MHSKIPSIHGAWLRMCKRVFYYSDKEKAAYLPREELHMAAARSGTRWV